MVRVMIWCSYIIRVNVCTTIVAESERTYVNSIVVELNLRKGLSFICLLKKKI